MADRPISPRPANPDAKFGAPASVDWITRQTVTGLTITSAIPPTFDAYATIVDVEPWSESGSAAQDVAIVGHLQHVGPTTWWLGYLDTGGNDVVFPRSRRIKMYADWPYVIVNGDAASALGWRAELPDLIFPDNRSWLVSTLWDDSWMCVGGPHELLEALSDDPLVRLHWSRRHDDSRPGARRRMFRARACPDLVARGEVAGLREVVPSPSTRSWSLSPDVRLTNPARARSAAPASVRARC